MKDYFDMDFNELVRDAQSSEFTVDSDTMLYALRDSIKQEVIRDVENELQQLRAENEKLSEFRDNYEQYQRELRKLRNDLENQEKMITEECRRKRLEDLIVSEVGYTIKKVSERGEKCDKCDSDRKLHFTSPLGRDMKEDCSCAAYHVRYEVVESKLFKFSLEESNGRIPRYYYRDHDAFWECNELVSTSTDDGSIYIYDNSELEQSFDDLRYYRAFFFYRSVAEQYADYLNAKEANK